MSRRCRRCELSYELTIEHDKIAELMNYEYVCERCATAILMAVFLHGDEVMDLILERLEGE